MVSLHAWRGLIERLPDHMDNDFFMPVMLIAAVDHFERQGAAADNRIPFAEVKDFFALLMKEYGAAYPEKAWQPFYYLAGRVNAWDLYKGELKHEKKGKIYSEPALLKLADHARFKDGLLDELRADGAPAAVKEALHQGIRDGTLKPRKKRAKR